MVGVMTTLIAVDGYFGNETRAKAVARRLRQEIAALDISKSHAAKMCGVSQPWMSRRLTGVTALAVDELDSICRTLGISYEYVTTGIRAFATPPPPGVPSLLLPRLDSNQQPSGAIHADLRPESFVKGAA